MQANSAMTDGQLLARFAASRDEAAFEALVRRQGPMVWNLCRRVLGNVADAEDAFQATFILLAQKAGQIEQPNLLAGWLHGVANRIALRARSQSHRRHTRERPMDAGTIEGSAAAPAADPIWRDLRPVLDEELEQLPQEYRTPVILCYLEGKTNQEAAQLLGCPMGTIASRLARGRDLLRNRLARRGLALSAATLANVITQSAASAAVTPTLTSSAVQAGMLAATEQTGAIASLSPQAAALANGSVAASSETAGLTGGAAFWSQPKLWAALVALLAAAALIVLVANNAPDRRLLQGHSLPVYAVAFAPDGRMLASGSLDGRVCLWDPDTGRRLHTLAGHDRGVLRLAFSNSGQALAVATWDGAVRLWDVASAREQATFRLELKRDQSEHINALAFSADDRWLTAGTWHGNIKVWDLATKGEKLSLPADNLMLALERLAFSPDGKTLVGLHHGGGTIRRWDLATGSATDSPGWLEHEFPGTFSPDGTVVTSTIPQKAGVGQGGNTVQFWDLATLKKGKTLVGHAYKITRMEFSRDGSTLVTKDFKGHIKVWDVTTGKERGAVPKPEAPARVLALSPDGKRLALGCTDNNVRLWDLSSTEP